MLHVCTAHFIIPKYFVTHEQVPGSGALEDPSQVLAGGLCPNKSISCYILPYLYLKRVPCFHFQIKCIALVDLRGRESDN